MIFTFIGIVLITLFMSGQSAALVSGSRLSRSGGSKENALQKNIRVLSNRPSVAFLSVSGRKDSIDSSNVADGVFKWYNDKLEKHPMLTKVVSSGVIGGLSDVLIQTLNARKGKLASFDFRRTAVFSAVCAFYFAPVINTWFNMLSKIPFPARISDTSKVLGMVAIDQTVGNAIVTAGFFYAFEIVSGFIFICFLRRTVFWLAVVINKLIVCDIKCRSSG